MVSRVKGTPGNPSLEVEKSALRKKMLWATVLFTVLFTVVSTLGALLIVRDLGSREASKVINRSSRELEEIVKKATALQTLRGYKQQTIVTTRLNEFMTDRKIFDSIELYDENGKLVYSNSKLSGGALVGGTAPSNLRPGQRRIEKSGRIPVEVAVPLKPGKVGKAILSVSQKVLARQADELQSALVTKLMVIFAVILLLIVLTYVYVFRVIRAGMLIEAEAQRKLRLSYMGLLSSGLAHEIKNPINSIQMNLQLLEEETGACGKEVPNLKEWLVPIRSEIKRLERLVNDFLMLSKPINPMRDVVGLAELLKSMASQIRAEALAKDVEISVAAPEQGVAVFADQDLLRSALLNLLLNAVQAVEVGGAVKLEAGQDGEMAWVEVSDNGPGIKAESRDRIFDIFFTTKRGGTGLGLPIAKRILEEMGGGLELLDSEETGARFRATLLTAAERKVWERDESGEEKVG